jgi:thiamine pyrophosphokinase
VTDEGSDRTVVVVSGGGPPFISPREPLPVSPYVIAADSGVARAGALGLPVHEATGDFDSADPRDVQRIVDAGAQVHRHAAAKDATDLELALALAAARRPRRIVVVGSDGGRLDHVLGNLLIVGAPAWAGVDAAGIEVIGWFGAGKVTVIRRRSHLAGVRGEILSLFAVGGAARGVTTAGLHYPLRNETLAPGAGRGVSNELEDVRATVDVTEGTLLAVQPGVVGTHVLRTSAERRLDVSVAAN